MISERGPTPGEDAAEPGDSPLLEYCDALKDLTLELRTGRLEGGGRGASETWFMWVSVASGEGPLC